ncbi:AAA family ATPase [Mycolicibacter heraklionensis]|uniref:AAA family ATPase n=1 Tax=Mycolicibacter heraklionensis TaxID=512402 RepID=A0A9X7WDS2_9MYCO|nr:LuxR family transcriptional regulator [Mycolicibacter heraklionensis]QZA06383.1 AAA family ATPase [Mycolicibacter heraklionensis]
MATEVVGREIEYRAVDELLAAVPSGPTALVVEGEAGIGKTTVWLAAVERAQRAGFRVLSARVTPAESVAAYTTLSDLLGWLDNADLAELPPPQRLAVDRALSRGSAEGPVTDQRAFAAAIVAVVKRLTERSPVVIAIDDLQWVDSPSQQVLSAVLRRLSGPIGVLATVRNDPEDAAATAWLELRRPDMVRRVRVRPLSVGATHTVLCEELGRSFARPTILRIHELSGGNPFYALELGRVIDGDTAIPEPALPTRLADLVRSRLTDLGSGCTDALLAAACLADPTLDVIASATDNDVATITEILEEAEGAGIVRIDGHRVTYAHPILARGVYTEATAARRDLMHRRLADIIDDPELKARHLALSGTGGGVRTLRALDAAAEKARLRGAPSAAAEFLDLAIGLGGDTPERRIRLAANHYAAGDPGRARSLLETTIAHLAPGALRSDAIVLLATIRMADDGFLGAAELLAEVLATSDPSDAAAVQMTVMLAYALFNGRRQEQALQHADEAVAKAALLDEPQLLAPALGMRATLRFISGEGVAGADMRQALELDPYPLDVPLAARPAVQNALLMAWTGQLDDAARELAVIRQRCLDQGEDSELIFLGFHTVLLQVWRGNMGEAGRVADATMELARQLGGDLPLFIALTIRAMHGAYAGRVDAVRRDIADALAAAQRSGSHRMLEWPITTLGFLDVSLGDYDAALQALAPLLAASKEMLRSTEIIAASFIPDAVEALTALGRASEAEPLVDALESNGNRLGRDWMLAIGGRCRAMLLAAQDDLAGAERAAQAAMAFHDRLPIPFERARTQLVLADVARRQHKRDLATAILRDALATFEDLGTSLWVDRCRAKLDQVSGLSARADLTASERRVAELAASGMSNREVAAALFVSPKTVEANLSRIYRKLGIRSRAELGRAVGLAE